MRDAGVPPLRGRLGVRAEAICAGESTSGSTYCRNTWSVTPPSARYGRSSCSPPAFPTIRAEGERGVPPIVPGVVPGLPADAWERVPGDHAGGGDALHADQDEPEQPGDRRQDVYLHRKLAYHPLPAEAEDAAGGRQGHGRMGTGDRIGSWGGELPTL